MKILLTGATGFLGSRIYQSLKDAHDVRLIPSSLLRGEMTANRVEKLYELASDFAPEALVHTAAISDMGYAEAHPNESYQANVALPEALARIASKLGCKLISCSSDQVYNGCDDLQAFDERTICSPSNTYGRHKLEAEKRVSEADPTAVSLRLTWMYDLPAYTLPTHPNLLTLLLTHAMKREPMTLMATDLRGVTYARQVASLLPLTFGLSGGAYNFGSESQQSVYELACEWKKALGLTVDIIPSENGQKRSLCMDCAKAKVSGIQFDDSAKGIARCIADYRLDQQ